MASLAVVTLNLAPELELQLRHELMIAPGKAGSYFLVELGAMAAASFLTRRGLAHLGGPRLAGVALALWVMGNAVSVIAAPMFAALVAARALAGLSAGALMVLALNAGVASRAPARLFALFVGAQLASGAALLVVLPPWMTMLGGLRGAYVLNLLLALPAVWLTSPLGRAQPPIAGLGRDRARDSKPGHARVAWQLGAAALLFNLTIGALWAFIGEFAQPLDLPAGRLATLLSLSTLAGLAAAGLAGILSARGSPRLWPAWGVIGLALGAAMIAFAGHEADFAAGCLVLSFAWNFSVPWLFALGAEIDGGAALMPMLNLAFALGLAAGPPGAGCLVETHGLGALANVVLLTLGATLALLIGLRRRGSTMVGKNDGATLEKP